jgi:hypothetical protein
VVHERVRGRQLEGEAVVVLPDKGEVKVLNEVGALLWSLADGRHSVRQMIATVCDEYEVPAAEAETDILAYLGELRRQGVLAM